MSQYIPTLQSFAEGTAATVGALSTVGAGLLYYGQNYLIYPSAFIKGSGPMGELLTPDAYGMDTWENLELKTRDGVLLGCYMLPQRREMKAPRQFGRMTVTPVNYGFEETDDEFMARRPTVIMFHGNGGNLGHRIPLGMMFQLVLRCNVLMVSYRGYGASQGSPSETGIRLDAQAALDYLSTDPRFSKTPTILFGQSIGGAVAIDLASRNPSKIHALILENTFTSLPDVVPHLFPFLGPFTFLCHQKWDSAGKIPLIPAEVPVLLLSGDKDEIVPCEQMAALRDLFTLEGTRRKGKEMEMRSVTWLNFPDAGHNDISMQRGYWDAVEQFMAKLALAKAREKEKERERE